MWLVWFHRLKIPFLSICIITYFGFHGYHGNRGYLTRIQLENRVADLDSEYQALVSEREIWEKRTELMRFDQLDYDLLDERARQLTAKIKPGEVILKVAD